MTRERDAAQGRMRVAKNGDVSKARYRHPDCQWQGGSREDCSDTIVSLDVAGTWPEPFTSKAYVCTTHRPAFIKAAIKNRNIV